MLLNTQQIAYCDGYTQLTGQFTWDRQRDGKRPGILIVHGGAGLDDHAKERSAQLAGLGYITFACDMYGAAVLGSRERIMATIMELRNDPAKLCRRATAGTDILAAHPQVDGRLAAVGYCFGGMTVLELARSGGADLAAIVSIHGSLISTQPANSRAIKSKMLVCHGALDPHVPMAQVTAFTEEMNSAAADWQLIIYGGAMHGFTHKAATGIPGVVYNALADARSSAALDPS